MDITELPQEVASNILQKFSAVELAKLSCVSKFFRDFCAFEPLWLDRAICEFGVSRKALFNRTHSLLGKDLYLHLLQNTHVTLMGEEWPVEKYRKLFGVPMYTHPGCCRAVPGLSCKAVSKVVLGDCHAAALTWSGQLFMFGVSPHGQCGGGACSQRPQPPQIPAELRDNRITEVALGTQHTLAVTADGELLAAGSTEHGRLGLIGEQGFGPSADGGCTCCPTFRQVDLPGGRPVRLAAAGSDFSCAVDGEGGLWTWGKADRGRLGHSLTVAKGEQREKMIVRPRQVETLAGVQVEQIACAPTNTLALASDGCAYSWGNGQQSRLGHGNAKCQFQPCMIQALPPPGGRITSLSLGIATSCCVAHPAGHTWEANDGAQSVGGVGGDIGMYEGGAHVLTHGWGGHFQHGFLDPKTRRVPTEAEELRIVKVHNISLGVCHSLAISEAGELWGWGYGGNRGMGMARYNQGNRQMGPLKLTDSSKTLVMSVSAWRNASLLVHCPWDQAGDGTLSICAEEPPEPEQPEPKKRSRAPTDPEKKKRNLKADSAAKAGKKQQKAKSKDFKAATSLKGRKQQAAKRQAVDGNANSKSKKPRKS